MADEQTKDIIKSCAENLLRAVQHLQNNSGAAQTSTSSTSTSITTQSNNTSQTNMVQTPTSTIPSTQASVSSTIQGEYRSLFSFRPPSNRGSSATPAPKRRTTTSSTGKRAYFPVRNTWTRTFLCLNKTNTSKIPTASEKASMALSGLQEKSITFNKDGNSAHVHKEIMTAFPQLQDAGGYEILRTGDKGNKHLMVLEIPPGGYTVQYLKTAIGSAKAYLRPLQKDIILSKGSVKLQVGYFIFICINVMT